MAWESIGQFDLTANWQYTEPVEGELFQLNYPDQNSIARALICQCEITDGVAQYFQIQRINANQREILEFKKPYCFSERRIAIKQIYGGYQWQLQLQRFMPVSNVPSVQSVSTTNPLTTVTDSRVSLTAGTAALVAAANANRKELTVTLESGGPVILRRGATAGLTVTSGGIVLAGVGASYTITPADLWAGQLSGISSVASVLNVSEAI